jgi:hypothetical protein
MSQGDNRNINYQSTYTRKRLLDFIINDILIKLRIYERGN